MRPETQDILNRLTADEKADLLAGLIQREKRLAKSGLSAIGSLFSSYLRVVGRRDLADQVEAMIKEARDEC